MVGKILVGFWLVFVDFGWFWLGFVDFCSVWLGFVGFWYVFVDFGWFWLVGGGWGLSVLGLVYKYDGRFWLVGLEYSILVSWLVDFGWFILVDFGCLGVDTMAK